MRATVQACTRPSRRHTRNEDRATLGDRVLTSTEGVEELRLTSPGTVAVLDGVGGAPCAETASDLAARVISAAELPRDEQEAAALLVRADRLLLDAGELDLRRAGMATTASMLVLADGGAAMVGNVGDSLVAHLDADGYHEVTTSDRIGDSRIFQSLGGFEDSRMRPHVTDLQLEVGDRLLLATDGLTDEVPTETITEILRQRDGDAAERLLELVQQAGTPDDVTIVIVDLEDDR